MKKWIGKLFHEVLSTGFLLFKSEKLNSTQMKVFCSERLVYNITKLVEDHGMDAEGVRLLNNFIKHQILDYAILKFPKSEDKEINQSFKKAIREVDSLSNNNNDLVFRSGVKFTYHEDGNYNSEIMEFLNYVVSLPD